MLLSIIIPVFNTKKEYLIQAIESVLNQTYKNIELILIDDGSTNDAPIICDEYSNKDSRVKVIHQKNAGVSFARNKGIDTSIGDYIFFMDNDDWIEPEAFELVIDYIEKTNTDVCFFDVNYIMKDTTKSSDLGIRFNETYYNMQDNNSLIAFTWLGLPFNFITKSACIKDKCYYKSIVHEDNLFVYNLYPFVSSFSIIKKPLYNYRLTEESASHKPRLDFDVRNNILYEEMMDLTERYKYPDVSHVVIDKYYLSLFQNLVDNTFCNQNISFFQKKKFISGFMNTDRFKEAINNVNNNCVSSNALKIYIKLKKPPIILLYLIYIYRHNKK